MRCGFNHTSLGIDQNKTCAYSYCLNIACFMAQKSLYPKIQRAVSTLVNEGVDCRPLIEDNESPLHLIVLERANINIARYKFYKLVNLNQLACKTIFRNGVPEVLESEEDDSLS